MTVQRQIVRVSVDIEVAIDPDHKDTRAWDVEKERALLLAIMADPDALRQEIIGHALAEMDTAQQQLMDGIGDIEDTVRRVLPRLPDRDDRRAYFERWLQEDAIAEATEYVGAAFTPTVRSAHLEVLPVDGTAIRDAARELLDTLASTPGIALVLSSSDFKPLFDRLEALVRQE